MTEGGIATPAQRAAAKPHRRQAPIVPPQNVAGRAMVFVIAIMVFAANSLTDFLFRYVDPRLRVRSA